MTQRASSRLLDDVDRPSVIVAFAVALAAAACGSSSADQDGGAPASIPFLPSNVEDRVPIDASSIDVVVGDSAYYIWVVDTDDGSIVAYDGVDPTVDSARTVREPGAAGDASGIGFTVLSGLAGGGEIAVFSLGRLVVRAGARLIGVGNRPLVIMAAREIAVDGLVTVGADRAPGDRRPGAGGSAGAAMGLRPGLGEGGGGNGTGGATNGCEGAGGGASFGGAGGAGGGVVEDAMPTAGPRGATYGAETLVPLVGGSGGGGGGFAEGASSGGGNGGGALELVAALRIVVAAGGAIDARGAGGHGGSGGGGGGAGSGGAILLEAPVVVVDGAVGANGGSGGQGDLDLPVRDEPGEDGAPGEPDRAPALGPPSIEEASAGGGGDGSDSAGVARDGASLCDAGGGGGGGGRIRINTTDGSESYEGHLLPAMTSLLATIGALQQQPRL